MLAHVIDGRTVPVGEFGSQVGILGESWGDSHHRLTHTARNLGLDGVFELLESSGSTDRAAGF